MISSFGNSKSINSFTNYNKIHKQMFGNTNQQDYAYIINNNQTKISPLKTLIIKTKR